jgi:predicted nucleotidyltransferase
MMTSNIDRDQLIQRLATAAKADPRIVGLVSYGSISEGRADVWSDIDMAVFVRDDDLAGFEASWTEWAGQFGTLLLGYISGVRCGRFALSTIW